MVAELKEDRGYRWQSFISERLPMELDDAIKAKCYDQICRATEGMLASDIYKALPMMFPMTHLLQDEQGKKYPGIARYPIDDWARRGAPTMTEKGWCKFAMKVALKDMDNLVHAWQTASKAGKFSQEELHLEGLLDRPRCSRRAARQLGAVTEELDSDDF